MEYWTPEDEYLDKVLDYLENRKTESYYLGYAKGYAIGTALAKAQFSFMEYSEAEKRHLVPQLIRRVENYLAQNTNFDDAFVASEIPFGLIVDVLKAFPENKRQN